MTDEIELWGEINNDLTDNGSLSTYKVDVYKLTSHLEQLYSKIEALTGLLEGNEYQQFLYSHLISLQIELQRQLKNYG